MEGTAVGLDQNALRAPEEVNLDQRPAVFEVEPGVDFRLGQADAADQSQEGLLQLARGDGPPDVVLGEGRSDDAGAAVIWIALELVCQGAQVEELGDLGLVECALDATPRHHRRQVQERARDRGAGDAVDFCDVCAREHLAAVNIDAGTAST